MKQIFWILGLLVFFFSGFFGRTIFAQDYHVYDNVDKRTKPVLDWNDFTIVFPKGKATISNNYNRQLRQLTNFLVENPNRIVELVSHASGEGKAKKELLLSEKRSLAVESYLLIHGVSTMQIQRFFYGSERPPHQNEPRLNRITHVRLLP